MKPAPIIVVTCSLQSVQWSNAATIFVACGNTGKTGRLFPHHCRDHGVIIPAQVVCELRSNPYSQDCSEKGTQHKSPTDCKHRPSLVDVAVVRLRESILFHDKCKSRIGTIDSSREIAKTTAQDFLCRTHG